MLSANELNKTFCYRIIFSKFGDAFSKKKTFWDCYLRIVGISWRIYNTRYERIVVLKGDIAVRDLFSLALPVLRLDPLGTLFLNIPYWNMGNIIKPYVVMIMQRFLRPLQVSAQDIEEVTTSNINESKIKIISESPSFEEISRINKPQDHQYIPTIMKHPNFTREDDWMLLRILVLDNEPIPKWTYFFLTLMTVCALFALFLLILTVYHGININDLSTMTEGGSYFIVLFYELLILLCTKINLPQYHEFLQILRENFKYVCTDGAKYRERYFANQLNTWKMCIFSVIFTSFIGCGVVTFCSLCLIWYFITHEPGDGARRPLLFPFWFYETDFTVTPIYEAAFMFSSFCSLAYAYSYIFMIQIQILWVGEIRAMADLVIWYIEDLMEGLKLPTNNKEMGHFNSIIKSRFKKIVRQHQLMYRLLENYTKVYKKLLMFEQKLSAPVVCLTAYCSVEKLSVGEVNGILMLLCGGTVIEVFIPSYLCTILGKKVRSVGDAFFNIPFWNMGNIIRPYIVIIMQRSLRPLQISAPGFEEVSVQTFSNQMASAYSFFNMLRQTNI